MSYGIPAVYAQPESLSIPATLIGDDLKTFGRGSRNTVRSIPTSSGSGIGPAGTILFSIPVGGHSYIKSNSMYIRMKVSVTQANGTDTVWGFGNNITGGASSLLNRITLNCGGVAMTYNNYNHFRNGVIPHAINADFISQDLAQLEYATVTKTNTTSSANNTTVYVSVPIWIPAFCSNQAFPALLLSSPMNLEILTSTIGEAFYSGTSAPTNYSLSEVYLVYETIDITPEFKSALLQSKANSFYNIALNDWWSVGPTGVQANDTTRYQIGCGLSSLKSILWTELTTASLTGANEKNYTHNGLTNYNIFVNNLIVSPPTNNLDDSMAFAELQRALGRINDSNICCNYLAIPPSGTVAGAVASIPVGGPITSDTANRRTTYPTEQFLGGCSVQVFSDWGFTNSGIDASTVTLELIHGTPNVIQWQNSTASANANLYVFLLHDSVFSVNMADGTVQIRK